MLAWTSFWLGFFAPLLGFILGIVSIRQAHQYHRRASILAVIGTCAGAVLSVIITVLIIVLAAAASSTPSVNPVPTGVGQQPTLAAPSPPSTHAPVGTAAGTVIGTYKGHGTANTPNFSVPASGNFIVSWKYSNNYDRSFGSSQPANFIIDDTSADLFSLPNDIASHGSGSAKATYADGQDSFNVEAAADCQWTITVTAG